MAVVTTYLEALREFDERSVIDQLGVNEQVVFYRLAGLNNRLHWNQWFYMTNQELMMRTGIKDLHTIGDARNKLKQLGYIDFKPGKARRAPQYSIVLSNHILNNRLDNTLGHTLNHTLDNTLGHTLDHNINNTKDVRRKTKIKDIDNIARAQEKTAPEIAVPYREIVEYLNEKAGTSYRSTSKDTQRHIHARWQEGYRLDDFKKVIDVKASQWLNDGKMSQYLRPSTLFGTKFEAYVNEKGGAGREAGSRAAESSRRDDVPDYDAIIAQQRAEGKAPWENC